MISKANELKYKIIKSLNSHIDEIMAISIAHKLSQHGVVELKID